MPMNYPQVAAMINFGRKNFTYLLIFFGLLVSCQRQLPGEILYASSEGFGVGYTTQIAASRAAVYDALVNGVGSWWEPSHTHSGDARNLSIDDRAGGCFCEQSGIDLSVRHAEVIFAQPGHILRLKGALGPLQELSVNGIMTIKLSPDDSGTRMEMIYRVGGYHPDGLGEDWAAAVDGVLTVQMERLKKYVEGL